MNALPTLRTGFARTDDGEQLYWRSAGSGPPLVGCNGVGVSVFFWKYIVQRFAPTHQVIVWDYRGHGRSTLPRDIPRADLSIPRNARDLFTVMDAAGARDPAVLLGHSMGCQVILEAHRQAPSRVRALIPMFGTFARPLDTFMDLRNARAIFERLRDLAARTDRASRRLLLPLYASPLAFDVSRLTGLVDRYYANRTDVGRYTDHLGHMHPDVFLGMVAAMAEHDLTEHLPHIDVPTLIFGGERDAFTPLHRSRVMAELIPGAELTIIADGSHAAIIEQPPTITSPSSRRKRC